MGLKSILSTVMIVLMCSQPSFASSDKPESQQGFVRRYLQVIRAKITPADAKFNASRRKFMRQSGGAAAGAAIMASGGVGVLASLSSKLPKDWLKKIVKMKPHALEQGGMEDYIMSLEKELGSTRSPMLRKALKAKISATKQSIVNVETILDPVTQKPKDIRSVKDFRKKLDSMSEVSKDPDQLRRNKERVESAKERLIKSAASSSDLTTEILTARMLLDPLLIRRMGYQQAYTDIEKKKFNIIAFTDEDILVLKDYTEVLEALDRKFSELSKPRVGALYNWLSVLRFEVDSSLEAYELSKKYMPKSCKAFL